MKDRVWAYGYLLSWFGITILFRNMADNFFKIALSISKDATYYLGEKSNFIEIELKLEVYPFLLLVSVKIFLPKEKRNSHRASVPKYISSRDHLTHLPDAKKHSAFAPTPFFCLVGAYESSVCKEYLKEVEDEFGNKQVSCSNCGKTSSVL